MESWRRAFWDQVCTTLPIIRFKRACDLRTSAIDGLPRLKWAFQTPLKAARRIRGEAVVNYSPTPFGRRRLLADASWIVLVTVPQLIGAFMINSPKRYKQSTDGVLSGASSAIGMVGSTISNQTLKLANHLQIEMVELNLLRSPEAPNCGCG